MKSASRNEKIKELLKSGKYKLEELNLLQDPILDDLYLKYLIETGRLKKEDVNNPWVVNYNDNRPLFLDTNKSLYQNYMTNNKNNLKSVAVYDFDNDRLLLHEEVQYLIDVFASGLYQLGVSHKSKVGVIANGCYEEPMCLFSPSKLGACVKFLDYFKGPIPIKKDVENSEIKVLFIDEMFISMEPLINEKQLPVIVLNATKKYKRYLTFDDVIKMGLSKSVKTVEMGPTESAIEINSSGTTGDPKPIVHTNMSANASAQKLILSGFPLEKGIITLKAIPSQIGLGSLTTLYTNLVSGAGIILIRPETKIDAFKSTVGVIQEYKKILSKYGISDESLLMIFASPMFIRSIYGDIDNIDDMSFIGGILAAGSKMSKTELENINEAFKSKGCKVPVNNGYGQNEQGGAVTLNTPQYDKPGSAGYPVIGTSIVIIDPENNKIIEDNEHEGKILVISGSQFKCYDGLDEETEKSKIVLSDGRVCFDTRDYGYRDSDGFIWITGRESRVITRSDFKIALDTIQDKLYGLGIFQELAVVSRFSQDETDEEPILFCELKDKNLSLEDITPLIESVLGPYERPTITKIVDKIPSLTSGKVDLKKVYSLAKELPATEDPKSLKLRFSINQK